MRNGTNPTLVDNRDYDYHQTFGTIAPPSFPDTFSTDNTFPFPNQEAEDTFYTPIVPPLPEGCTDYAQSQLSTDLDGILKNPLDIEAITHANANGGADIRVSLQAAIQLGWISAFFNVRPQQLDFFDTIRLAMLSGLPEKRSVTVGVPWFPIYEQVAADGILQAPASFSTVGVPWHNHKICAWKLINGQTYLISKSWQGSSYGDHGYCYWSRSLLNAVMTIPGTVAFTGTLMGSPTPVTISVSTWQYIMSIMRYILSTIGFSYGGTAIPNNWWTNFWRAFDAFWETQKDDTLPTVPSTPPNLPPEPSNPPEPAPALQSLLLTFCSGIAFREGANPANNNPGNCKYSYGGYLPIYGNVTRNPHGFAVFPTKAQGDLYLQNLVRQIIRTHKELTFITFFAGDGDWFGYAPSSDGNDPVSYGGQVAERCGYPIDTVLSTIIV